MGSISITIDNTGAKVSEMRYKPWGEVHYSWTSAASTTPSYSLADYTFTGQYSYMDDPSTSGVTEGFDLMFYNARWYDPGLGRFAQPDTMIPQSQGVQAWDRYAFVNNNPVRYTDPSGHCISDPVSFMVCAMVAGAVIDASINAYSQYKETGKIDGAEVLNHALEGAVIGGGVVIVGALVLSAATALIPAATLAGTAACADSDCTNEVAYVANSINQACGGDACAGEMQDAVRSGSTAISTESAVWTPMGNNAAGGTFYGSNNTVIDKDISQLAGQLSIAGSGEINILTGAHGSPMGNLFQRGIPTNGWAFYLQDLALKGGNVSVYNIYLTPKSVIEQMKGNIICAWCWSESSKYIKNIIE